MIPESGTRLELKQAWFASRLIPVPGEFYASRQFYGADKEYFRVTEVKFDWRNDSNSVVMCDSLCMTPDFPMLIRRSKQEAMTVADWCFMISEGFMDYMGDNVPVATGLVIREQ